MAQFVVDASVAVEYLLKSPLGLSIASELDTASISVPQMLDAEVMSALRRLVLRRELENSRALDALNDLVSWPVERLDHRALIPVAWEYRHNISSYDALYVAAAHLREVPLLTADGPLSRASGLGIVVQNVRIA